MQPSDEAGLCDYSYLTHRLQNELSRAERHGRSLSLVRLEIDNPTALEATSRKQQLRVNRLLSQGCRKTDVAGHHVEGGYALILPETGASGAFTVAERIREELTAQGNSELKLSASAGVASYPAHAANLDDLIKQASNALELAKNSGRNRVCSPENP